MTGRTADRDLSDRGLQAPVEHNILGQVMQLDVTDPAVADLIQTDGGPPVIHRPATVVPIRAGPGRFQAKPFKADLAQRQVIPTDLGIPAGREPDRCGMPQSEPLVVQDLGDDRDERDRSPAREMVPGWFRLERGDQEPTELISAVTIHHRVEQ